MTSLLHSLNIGSEALFANRQGLDTTAHNIANAQTEGYSRQRVQLTQRNPIERQGNFIGDGVYIGSIDRVHDKYVERQLNLATMDLGMSETRSDLLSTLEGIYAPELGSSVSEELDSFFTALQDLSRDPEELTIRTSVREQGENLCSSFRRVDEELRRFRDGVNEKVAIIGAETNQIIDSIAHLNSQIREKETSPEHKANDLRDRRDNLIRKLSEKMDINFYEDKDGMITIHGPAQTLLVDRGRGGSIKLERDVLNQGMYRVKLYDSEGTSSRDITKQFDSGALGAMINIRDHVTTNLIKENNTMANTLVKNFNAIHSQGFGQRDFRFENGRNFFKEVRDFDHCAQELTLDFSIISSTDAISAASLPDSFGDNVIANKLNALRFDKILDDGRATLNQYYADYIGVLGMESLRSKNTMESDKIIAADLQSRRESVAGVSLDEEAANMIKWQTAFTASSKVITTVDEMIETVLNLKR